MNWKDINKELPIDHIKCFKMEVCEVLVVCDGDVQFDEFKCGHLPEPWWEFESSHKGMVTHWIKKDDIELPNLV